jgi:hypothetical protein
MVGILEAHKCDTYSPKVVQSYAVLVSIFLKFLLQKGFETRYKYLVFCEISRRASRGKLAETLTG